jgi:hypothetical protein
MRIVLQCEIKVHCAMMGAQVTIAILLNSFLVATSAADEEEDLAKHNQRIKALLRLSCGLEPR